MREGSQKFGHDGRKSVTNFGSIHVLQGPNQVGLRSGDEVDLSTNVQAHVAGLGLSPEIKARIEENRLAALQRREAAGNRAPDQKMVRVN
jgi:hypothetical protein